MAFHRTVVLVACATLLVLVAEKAYGLLIDPVHITREHCIPLCLAACRMFCHPGNAIANFCGPECSHQCKERCRMASLFRNGG
uniref:Uncharacterized protein n=1 Tax=Rhipicephalus appendiculatus TaxID=34631 RepID=A0A131YCV6_RHIAP